MARQTLTDNQIAKLKPKDKRYTVSDPDLRGHYVRVTPNGVKTFVAVARNGLGKQIWATIGGADVLKIADARERAREAIKRIKDGLDAFESPPEKPDTFKAVTETYIKRHVEANELRSQAEVKRIFGKYIMPHWSDREFQGIRRSDVAKLLDVIEDNHGGRQAYYVLAVVRGLMNW